MKKIYTVALLLITSLTLTACTSNDEKNAKKTSVDKNLQESQESNEVVENIEKEENLKANILDLMKLGKSVKCTYEVKSEDATTKGQTYVSNGKTRTEMTIDAADGTKIDSFTITEGDWMYMWSSESEQGNKISLKEMESAAKDAVTENSENEASYNDQMEKVDYKCSPWIADDSKFNIPTNIEFIDLSEMMKGFLEMSKNLPASE